MDDLVIFKKSGKEWHYGKIVAKFSDRSYIIKDSFDNHFRRNRRFIAKTKKEDFNASDLLFEENIKSGQDVFSNNLKEIQIVNPSQSNKEKSARIDDAMIVNASNNYTDDCTEIETPVNTHNTRPEILHTETPG